MTLDSSHASLPPVLTSTEAQLYVCDVEISCAFYIDLLGFSLAFTSGAPANYAQVFRDQARLNLRHVDGLVFANDIRVREQLLSATLTLGTAADTRQLHSNYLTGGVSFFQALRVEPWGATTFVVQDPDGNLIMFAGPAD